MVPAGKTSPDSPNHLDEPLETRAVQRGIALHQRSAERDVRRLLDVGLALIAAHEGHEPPRVADIVRAAGLSNDAFYRYFASKDDLLAAIVDDGARRLLSHVRHQLDKSSDPALRLRLAVDAVLRQAADPEVAAITRAVIRNAGTRRLADPSRGVWLASDLAALLTGPLADLGSNQPGRDARVFALTILGAMEHFLWSEEAPSSDDIDHLVRFLLRGALVRAGD